MPYRHAQHWERDEMVENATRKVRNCRVELQTQNSPIALKIEPSELTGGWKGAGVGEDALRNMPFGSPGECESNICIWTSGEWRQGVERE